MKRILTAALLLALIMTLPACGAGQADLQPMEPVETESAEFSEELVSASETDAEALPHEAPASGTDAAAPVEDKSALDEAAYEAAQACIGKPASELFAVLGEPESSQYAASCEQDGAEDGMLFYDGFYVWTLKTDSDEIVRAVYPDD